MAFPDIPMIEIRWAGIVETNLGDRWRARWIPEEEFPTGAPVIYAWANLFAGDRGYVLRKKGETVWGTLEGDVDAAEGPIAFLRRAAQERAGITVDKLQPVGYLLCRATRHNQDYELGAPAIMAVYAAVAGEVGEVPDDSEYERRRLPLNEFGAALRLRYPEVEPHLANATQRYMVMRAKGEA